MINFLIGIIIGIGITLIIQAFLEKQKVPQLIGPELPKNSGPLKTYAITNSAGEKEYIMSSKTMTELLSELNYLADLKECITLESYSEEI